MISETVKVLFVDEDETHYNRMNRLLNSLDTIHVHLDWVTTPETALTLIRAQSQHYDAYFIDVGFPGVEGDDGLIEELSGTTSPVIVLTPSAQIGLTALKKGAADYLVYDQLSTPLIEHSLRLTLAHSQTQKQLHTWTSESQVQTEALHEIILSTISDTVFITDDRGNFTFVCPNVHVIFGYSRLETQQFGNICHILGDNWLDLNQLKAEQEITNIERQIIDKFGNFHNLLINVKQVAINGGTILYTCHDISKRKQDEVHIRELNNQLEQRVKERTTELQQINAQLVQEIRERRQIEHSLAVSEERFRGIFDQAAVGIAQATLDGAFIVVNQKFADIIGYTCEEVLAKSWQDITHPDDMEADEAYVRQLLAKDIDRYSIEKRYIHKDGSVILVQIHTTRLQEPSGAPQALIGVIEDITQRKQIECQLQDYRNHLEDLVEQRAVQLVRTNQHLEQEISERQRAESAIYFQARLLDLVNHGVIATDLSGMITYWNHFAEILYGWSATEVIGRAIIEVLAPKNHQEKAIEIMQILQRGEGWTGEFWVQHRDGTIFPVQATNSSIYDETGQFIGIVGVSFDLTERKQVEVALQQANAELGITVQEKNRSLTRAIQQLQEEIRQRKQAQDQLQLITDALPVCIAYLDADLRYQFANKTYQTWFGLSPEVICGKTVPEVIGEDAYQRVRGYLERVIGGEYVTYETEIPYHSGGTRYVFATLIPAFGDSVDSDSPRPIQGYYALITDISDRKRMELALRESQQKYQTLFDILPIGFSITDETGHIIEANPASETILGISIAEQTQRHYNSPEWRGIRPNGTPMPSHEFASVIALTESRVVKNSEAGIHKPNGEIVWLSITAAPISLPGYGVAIAYLDITERKTAEMVLQQAKDAADAANLAKSEFLANMSHELRTPLNAILGFTQLMSHDPSLSPQHQNYLSIINHSGEHLLALINDILSMSKIEAGRMAIEAKSFDLYQLMDTIKQMFRVKSANKYLEFITQRSPQVPRYVQTDENKLRQVLINLLDNAVKFTDKGRITLTLDMDELNTLQVSIQDTGQGIATDELDSLFEPFVQTKVGKDSQTGTGLGLAIVQRFIQMIGGEITVNSQLGEGTQVEFSIPITPAEATEVICQSHPNRVLRIAPEQPSYRILVIEDNPTSCQLLCELLETVGFDVQCAENGQQGIMIWDSWYPHLIWMDIRMPVMDGKEATRWIRDQERQKETWQNDCSATVIIAITASAFTEEIQSFLDSGCDDFVIKPIQEGIIFEKMAQHLGVRYLYNDATSVVSSDSGDFLPTLTPERLGLMPEMWRVQLNQAASSLDEELMRQLVEQIPDSHRNLATALLQLIDEFKFDQIVNLTMGNGK
ncbi:PAS domain S-box protein [Coleofasciculus chthonoplastes]|uniref:PAS domain S-box protein n=1 Tax=Coleofasciculus chthonoplastes TaxID=64178 RepID=UPI0033021D1D